MCNPQQAEVNCLWAVAAIMQAWLLVDMLSGYHFDRRISKLLLLLPPTMNCTDS